MEDKVHEQVSDYYGKRLQGTQDLKTDACTSTTGPLPDYIQKILSTINEDVTSHYYGCGLVVPESLEGTKILDLGSGSGRDCFIMSKLVGEKGSIVGVDMTREQLEIAKRNIDYHTKKFGFSKPNVDFKKGFIEHLDQLGLDDNSFDIIVSNCVINLAADKEAVLKQAYRILKHGGELYFSDIYSDRRVPAKLREDPVLYGECMSGALYWNDFIQLAKKVGFRDPRLVDDSKLAVNNQEIKTAVGPIQFFSATYRLFKIADLEPSCEDYGQAVIYKGTVPTSPHVFKLDQGHQFPTGKVITVCNNSFLMLHQTRFREHFTFIGDTSTHYGFFPETAIPFQSAKTSGSTQPSSDSSCGTGSCCG